MATIVFIGDSITDCGRRTRGAPHGDGYMNIVRQAILEKAPTDPLTWVNRGVSGDTVRELSARWQADAIETAPDWLSVMIGINDVWRGFDDRDDAVPLSEFEPTLRRLLGQVVDKTGTRLVLADPYIIEADRGDPQRVASDAFGAVVRQLAAEFGALHVATQAVFDRALINTSSADWSDDRIHPNTAGHQLIADEYLRVVGDLWLS